MLVRTIGAFIAMLCGYACYWSARWAIADWAIRSSVEHALRLAPGNPEYYLRLARAKPALALSALRRAADLNPLNSSVWIELAGAAEEHQDFRGAESSLLRAVQLDKTFAPRWLLAEYYSRRHDQTHFWPAVRAALATSYDDVTPLFSGRWPMKRASPGRTTFPAPSLPPTRWNRASSSGGRISSWTSSSTRGTCWLRWPASKTASHAPKSTAPVPRLSRPSNPSVSKASRASTVSPTCRSRRRLCGTSGNSPPKSAAATTPFVSSASAAARWAPGPWIAESVDRTPCKALFPPNTRAS